MELAALEKKYGVKLRECVNAIYVTSKLDEWYIELGYEGEYPLFHKNKKWAQNKYHYHRGFNTLDEAVESIHQHDNYNLKNPLFRKRK